MNTGKSSILIEPLAAWPAASMGRGGKPWRRAIKSVFTLVELLVVVVIIAILASILLPALKGAKDMARRTICAGNLKQLGNAMNFYIDTFQDYLPPCDDGAGYTWAMMFVDLGYYSSPPKPGIYHPLGCPSNPKPYLGSYGYNYMYLGSSMYLSLGVGGGQDRRLVKITLIRKPSETIMMADTYYDITIPDDPGEFYLLNPWPTNWYTLGPRHSNGANILWVDGHTTYFKPESLVNRYSGILANGYPPAKLESNWDRD